MWWRKFLFTVLTGCFLLPMFTVWGESDTRPVKNVLMLVSYHMTHDWTRRFVEELEQATRTLPYRLSFNVIEMDALRSSDAAVTERAFLGELPRLQAGKYDMVVLLDDAAMQLTIRHADALPPDVPVIFAGVEKFEPAMRERHPNMTGVLQNSDPTDTIRLALSLYPEAEDVVILADSSPFSRQQEIQLRKELTASEGVNIRYLNDPPKSITTLLEEVRALPKESVIVLMPWRELFGNDYQSVAAFGIDLAHAAKRPFFTQMDTMQGFGALGGALTLAADQADSVAGLIKQTLADGSAAEIPVVPGGTRLLIDYDEMKEHGLPFERLSPQVEVLNLPPSLWKKYYTEILWGGAGLGVLLLGILAAQLMRRRMVKRSMQLFRALPGRIGACTRRERILFLHHGDGNHEILNCKWLRDIPGIDYATVSAAVASVFATGQSVACDYQSGAGKRSMVIAPLEHGVFGVDSVVWFSYDNSELQESRNQLEDLLSQHQVILNKMPGYVVTKDVESGFRLVSCNEAFLKLLGGKWEEVRNRTDFELPVAPEDARNFLADDEAAVASPSQEYECMRSFAGPDGKRHYGVFFRQVLALSNRKRLLLTVVTDVTELHLAKVAAEETAERFELTLRAIGDAVLATDCEGRITMLNPVAERLLGCPQQEALGRPHEEIFRIVSYLDDTPVASPVARTLKTGVAVELANHTDLLALDGKRYHIADSAAPIRNVVGEIIGAILVFRDVTEEYDKRDQLRTALLTLDYGSELSDMAAFNFDVTTGRMTGSKLLNHLWPQTPDGPLPRRLWVYPEDLEKFNQCYRELCEGIAETVVVDYRSNYHGEIRYYRMKASLDRNNPQVKCIVGVMQDITEITRNARKLNDTLVLWNLVIDSIPVMIFAKSAKDDFRYILANKFFSDFVGRSSGEIVGKNDYEIFRPAESAEWFREKDQAIMCGGKMEEFLENPLDGDGNRRNLRTTKVPFAGADGEPLLLGVSVDISELNNRIESERVTNNVLAQVVLESDFDTNMKNIFDALSEQFRCDRVTFILYDRLKDSYSFQSGWQREGISSVGEISAQECQRLYRVIDADMKSNRLTVASDMTGVVGAEYGAKSAIAAPIYIGNELWAVLVVAFHAEWRHFSAVDEKLMRSMANIIALAQIRERQNQAIARADYEKQMILNNIKIPIWLYDRHAELLRANTAVGDLAGIPAEQLDTESNRRIFCLDNSDMEPMPVLEVIQTGQSVRREVHHKGGDYIVSAEPVFDEHGELLYVITSAVDVTRLNAFIANEKVFNFCLETFFLEDDVQQAIEQVLEAVCVHMKATRCYVLKFDMEQGVSTGFAEYVMPGAEHIFTGRPAAKFNVNEPWVYKFLRREPVLQLDMSLPGAMEELGSWGGIAKRQQIKSVYAAGVFSEGKLWGDIGIIYEKENVLFSELELSFLKGVAHLLELLLERQQAREQLMQALRLAQAADRAKSFFIASVSHEIRTPLNAVIGFAELLRDGKCDPEAQKDYLDSIACSGNALLQLINDVLDLSKLEAGQMQLVPEPTDFAELGSEVLKIFTHRARQNGVTLRLEMAELPVLELDRLRIRQILFNLIGNAVKFTEQGTVTLWANFSGETPGEGILRFGITDTGIGIATADCERLMEPFVQLSGIRGSNAATQGTGLGLSIAKRLAERMGGEMWLESEPGKGSTFGVNLYRVVSQPRSSLVRQEETISDEKMKNPELLSLLLVDDVEMNLKVMTAMLQKAGVRQITAVTSGEAALRELENQRFDLVLTDMWMPGLNGAELAAKILANPRFAKLPVVAVTADVEAKDNFELNIFAGVLLKPVSLEKMQKMLVAVLGNDFHKNT